jgi:hypothetical protein
MAILVIFDMVHKSLVLHSIRVLVYSTTLFIFYYSAWYSYDLTGSEGFRASCPASCQFKHYSNNWIVVVAAGSPIYLFIITDLFRKILETRGLINPKTWIQEKPMSELTVFQKFKSIFFQHGFQVARFLVWGLCLVDLCVACFGVFSSWFIWRYDGLVLSPDFDDISWGFGQLVAVILICLPVLTMAEEWKGKTPSNPYESLTINSHYLQTKHMKSGFDPQHPTLITKDQKSITLAESFQNYQQQITLAPLFSPVLTCLERPSDMDPLIRYRNQQSQI